MLRRLWVGLALLVLLLLVSFSPGILGNNFNQPAPPDSPLKANLSIRFHHLQAGLQPEARITVRFSRPVSDRSLAQERLQTNQGSTAYRWLNSQTLVGDVTGLAFGSHLVAMLDPGIKADGGSPSEDFVSAGLAVPQTITRVDPARAVQLYYVNTESAHTAFFEHLDQIDILSPSWYGANADGSVTSYVHRDVLDAAHAHGIQVVPLVVNANVDPEVAHSILSDPARRARLAEQLARDAATYGYAGYQLDFEQVRSADRDLLTQLVRECAAVLHRAHLSLSVAVIPRLGSEQLASGTLLDYYHAWSGVYDFPALARYADFLSYMTYDEHNGVTGPGPVAGLPWMRAALDYSLKGVPPAKVMLGLPTYYRDWSDSGKVSSSSFDDAQVLAQRFGSTPVFDPVEDEMHLSYDTPAGHHELWYESGDTLRQKLPLIYEYGLKGISVWRIGFEDPRFWDLIDRRG